MHGPLDYEETKTLVRDFRCAECGGRLGNPWGGYYGVDGYIVRCVKDVAHQGIQRAGRPTRWLYDIDTGWREFDVMTQRPIEEPAALAVLPETEDGMVARIHEAVDVGKFPDKDLTAKQIANLVKLSLYYRLDPLGGEIMPYQGTPYITMEGRRRLDRRAGNNPDIKIRPMDRETYADYVAMDAITQGDIVVVGSFTDSVTGNTVETIGRVFASERKGNPHLPIAKWPLEMAIKRCEMRGRKLLYGPVTDVGALGFEVREEGIEYDDGMVIDVDPATGEIVDPPSDPPERPHRKQQRAQANDVCESHGKQFAPTQEGRIGHPLEGGGWCWQDDHHDRAAAPQGDLPANPESAVDRLRERIGADGIAWPDFLASVLGVESWEQWRDEGGTPRSAWDLYEETVQTLEREGGRAETPTESNDPEADLDAAVGPSASQSMFGDEDNPRFEH